MGRENSEQWAHMSKGLDVDTGFLFWANRKEASVPEVSVRE